MSPHQDAAGRRPPRHFTDFDWILAMNRAVTVTTEQEARQRSAKDQ